jgi:hypothetical protein
MTLTRATFLENGMRMVRSGVQAPARWRAFACGLVLLATCMLAASAGAWMPHLSPLFSADLTPDPDAKLPAPTVAAGDAWELTVGRDGEAWSPLQLY